MYSVTHCGRYHVLPVGFVTLCFHCDCWSFVLWLVKSWMLYFLLHSEASSCDEWSFSCFFLYCTVVLLLSLHQLTKFGFVTWRTVLLLWLKLRQWKKFWLLLCVCRTFVLVLQLKLHQWLKFGCCFVTWRTVLLLMAETSSSDEWSFCLLSLFVPHCSHTDCPSSRYKIVAASCVCALPECGHNVSYVTCFRVFWFPLL